LKNSILKLKFPLFRRTSSKYCVKHRTRGQLCFEQTSRIWCKNIHAFVRNYGFRFGAFYFDAPSTPWSTQTTFWVGYNAPQTHITPWHAALKPGFHSNAIFALPTLHALRKRKPQETQELAFLAVFVFIRNARNAKIAF